MVVIKCSQKQYKMPSIKRKKDAPQPFIQHFIGPSCTAPGLWIGIWSWLDNQKIPSSDKWGFFSVCEKAGGVCFPQGLWNRERNWTEGPRVFPYGAWDTVGRTPLLPSILTHKIYKTLSGLHSYKCRPLSRSTTYKHTEIRLQKLCVEQPVDHNRGKALRRRQQEHERGL